MTYNDVWWDVKPYSTTTVLNFLDFNKKFISLNDYNLLSSARTDVGGSRS